MTIVVSRAGISETGIKPDSPEWIEWFASQPEGTKIKFQWDNDACKRESYTAYRRKRYWEAQKRVSGKLRNTTIKPEDVTYEALKRVGLKLTAYNWAEKFELEKSGTFQSYQTSSETSSQAGDEISELKAENEALKGRISYLLDERGLTQAKANDGARIEIKRLQKLNDQLEKENHQLNRVYTQSEDISRKHHLRWTELQAENDKLKHQLEETSPSALDLINQYEAACETIKQSLPKPPDGVTRNWFEFWRFKTWVETQL